MGIFNSSNDFFALDIGTTALRVVQLRGSGTNRSLVRYGSMAIDSKISKSEAKNHKSQLVEMIQKLIADVGITTNNVVIGVPTNKMFATVVDFPNLNPKELAQTIKYQADQHIPTAPNDSKIDWSVLGGSPVDPKKIEVLLASTTNKFAEERLDLVEAAGLNVLAMEPDVFALSRSLVPADSAEATMILDMGSSATDLSILWGGNPRLVRSIPVGGDTLLKAAQQNLGVDAKQAMQFVYKFGLIQDKLEGQVYKALTSTVDNLVKEVEKSVKFFSTRYNNVPISKIIVTGRASVLPEFPVYLVNKTNIAVEIGNSWTNVSYPRQSYNDLMSVSNQYAVAVGLAERTL